VFSFCNKEGSGVYILSADVTTGLDAVSKLGEEVLVMGCNVGLWLVGATLGIGLMVLGERGDSVTAGVAGGGGITVGREG
jgi:hypothetical protein